MYNPITAIEVTAKYAVVLNSEGLASRIESPTQSQMEFVGVPVRGLTFFHSDEPGSALSREKAKDIREFAVTDAMPQKNCATQTMNSRNCAIVVLSSASRKICAGGSPVSEAERAASPSSDRSGIAAVME